MKKFLLSVLVLLIVLAVVALIIKNPAGEKPATTLAHSMGTTASSTTAFTTPPASTTVTRTEKSGIITNTKAATTTKVENLLVVTGAPDPNAGTYTGYKPLPPVNFTVADPDNMRGLSEKATGFGFGLGKNGSRPTQSINNQKMLDKYKALALDVKSEGKVLYLTFDCGYENGYTGKILDTLKAKKVPAAFFCTLPFIRQQPALVTRMIKEGHIVGNHSDSHPVFPNISRTEMAKEVQTCDNYLRTKFGYTAPYFRFPTGSYSDNSLELVQSLGFQSVFWSVAYADWDPAKQKGTQFALDTVTSRLHPGAVILLHAVSKDNTAALGDIVDWARAQGYVFKSL